MTGENDQFLGPQKDQFVRVLGDIGRWQWFMFLLVGCSLIVGTYPVLIMTFMNADVDFWCAAEAEGVNVSETFAETELKNNTEKSKKNPLVTKLLFLPILLFLHYGFVTLLFCCFGCTNGGGQNG